MPPKCMSCVKHRETIDKKNITIEDLRDKLVHHKESIADYGKIIDGLKEELVSREPEPITTTIDLTPYFHKLDRIAALTKTDDMDTFMLELGNFKTMLNHIKYENGAKNENL
jgi:hypothetical protein